jgi:hypothetical protein
MRLSDEEREARQVMLIGAIILVALVILGLLWLP